MGVGIGTGVAYLSAGSSGTDNVDLVIKTANAGTESERMRITYDGKVGIGTDTPLTDFELRPHTGETVKLTITGDKSISAVGDEFCSLDFRSGGDTSPGSDNDITGRIVSVSESSTGAQAGIAFYTCNLSGSSFLSERVRIDKTGKVGIGTTTPEVELHVNGTIRSDNLTASMVVVTDESKNLVSGTSENVTVTLQNALGITRATGTANIRKFGGQCIISIPQLKGSTTNGYPILLVFPDGTLPAPVLDDVVIPASVIINNVITVGQVVITDATSAQMPIKSSTFGDLTGQYDGIGPTVIQYSY
jgi:hypothetical protein